MIQTLDLRGRRPTRAELVALVPRAVIDVAVATETAAALIAEVRERGEAALLDQAERLDGVRPDVVRVDPATITAAVEALDPAVRAAHRGGDLAGATGQRGAGAAARRDRTRRRARRSSSAGSRSSGSASTFRAARPSTRRASS